MRPDFEKLALTGWYPGHMLKAGREMRDRLALIDLVVELLDARLPLRSRNPAFEAAFGDKPRLLVFNKADLADPAASRRWEEKLRAAGERPLFLDARTGAGVGRLLPLARATWDEVRRQRGATRPMLRPLRLLIAGIPNVGKSTLVNRLAQRHKAAVGPKPGVTRQVQWISLQQDVDLLDSPGVIWPRIGDKESELCLGLIGSIQDAVLGEELLAECLWWRLRQEPAVNWPLYGLAACPAGAAALLEAVAVRRGHRQPGGGVNRRQAAVDLIQDYREGRLGRFTFDAPDAAPDHS